MRKCGCLGSSKKTFSEIHKESIREFKETGEAFLGQPEDYTTQKGTYRKKFLSELRDLHACLDVRYTQRGAGYENLYLIRCKK